MKGKPFSHITPSPLTRKEQGVFLLSDLHLGSSVNDEELLRNELAEAKKRKDRIAINGDVFDLILTRDSKRYHPSALHESLQGRDDLVNASLKLAVDLLSPVVDQIDMIGVGNHETSVEKYHNTCVVSLLIDALNHKLEKQKKEHRIAAGGYAGFLHYSIGEYLHSIFYWHGAGGGKGLGNVLAEFIPKGFLIEGADTLWFAHRHVRVVSQLERLAILNPPRIVKGRVSEDTVEVRKQWLLRTGGYLASHGVAKAGEVMNQGRQGNYAADSLLLPAGRGGLRLVLSENGTSRVEVVS